MPVAIQIILYFYKSLEIFEDNYVTFTVSIYRKSGNFHVEIIHVVNIQCRFIFVGLLYPRKYFNMNLFQQKHLAIIIVHVLLISPMNISL